MEVEGSGTDDAGTKTGIESIDGDDEESFVGS